MVSAEQSRMPTAGSSLSGSVSVYLGQTPRASVFASSLFARRSSRGDGEKSASSSSRRVRRGAIPLAAQGSILKLGASRQLYVDQNPMFGVKR